MKRIVITGAEGFLGARLKRFYQEKQGKYETAGIGRSELDITDRRAVLSFMERVKPDQVFHCAAVSDVGQCEKRKDLSEQVNVQAPAVWAEACRRTEARLVFMSSDQIYTGTRDLEKNREDRRAQPVNVYGRHKLEAEREILGILPGAVCLRLAWMYDFPGRGLKTNSNLLVKLFGALIRNEALPLPENDYRGITYVWEAVRHMDRAGGLPGGVYNYGSENGLCTYETARVWLECLEGLPGERKALILPDRLRFQETPRNLAMDLSKLRGEGIDFCDTRQGFLSCMRDYGIIGGKL